MIMKKPTSIIRLLTIAVGLCSLQEFAAAATGPRGARKAPVTRGLRNYEDGDFSRVLKEQKETKHKTKKAPSKRNCEIDEKNDTVEFKCKSETDEEDDTESIIEDEIKFKVESKGEEPLKVEVEYKQTIENVTTDEESETNTNFEVTFDRVIEYRKADAASNSSDDTSMAYDWDGDTIVQEWTMENWNEFTAVVNDMDTNLATFSISTPDDIATFKFTIARADAGNITANKMKIDFDLANFPWLSDDTYVALICSVQSERTIEVEEIDADDEDGDRPMGPRLARDVTISFDDAVDTIGFTPFGAYSWADYAEATPANSTNETMSDGDTEIISVIATSPANATSNQIAFSFVGEAAKTASDIYWDSEAGIGYGTMAANADVGTDAPGAATTVPDPEAGTEAPESSATSLGGLFAAGTAIVPIALLLVTL